jgi:hypothetical protein
MTLVAAASPRAVDSTDEGEQLLAEVDDVIVRVLFDDIVRRLTTPVAARDPEPGARAAVGDVDVPPRGVWAPSIRVHPGRSRSPPRPSDLST